MRAAALLVAVVALLRSGLCASPLTLLASICEYRFLQAMIEIEHFQGQCTISGGTSNFAPIPAKNNRKRASPAWRDPQNQEAQLMSTNLRDAFVGQSRSTNIAPFHMLGMDSNLY